MDGGFVVSLNTQKDFVVLISARGQVNPRALVLLEGVGILKKSNDLIGT
jgi:hypothetical protein